MIHSIAADMAHTFEFVLHLVRCDMMSVTKPDYYYYY